MEIIEILGFAGALLIGVVLGLIGGGGSILTVPILVYALAFNPVIATAYSLFVVGTTSLVGALKNMRKGLVDFKTALVFAAPALTAVYITRAFIIPAIPANLITIYGFTLTKNVAIMVFFAIVMLMASVRMIKDAPAVSEDAVKKQPATHYLLIYGLLIGFVTGAVGAGGGFLIVPALIFFAFLPMKKAVATSLLIIAVNSLIGFIGDVQQTAIDWTFLLSFTSLSVIGIFIGMWLNNFIDGKKLKKGFGWFVLVMGIYIIYKELAV
ncbi:MAG: sulfite exporter TauE/SafE family protein [Nonlabens sp.]|nr:sulfite exporter TauE/SafE family protein [Nonlabens sp.]